MGAANSYCAIRYLSRPDRPRFEHAQFQRSEERVQRGAETHSTVAGRKTTNFRRTWSLDQSALTPLIWGCLSAECTRDPLSTFLSQTSISNGYEYRTKTHSVLLSFPSAVSRETTRVCRNCSRSRRSQQHGEQCGQETTNSVATVSGLCPLLHQQAFPSRPQVKQLDSMTLRPRRTCPWRM